jgi:FkbM family methyltransferase
MSAHTSQPASLFERITGRSPSWISGKLFAFIDKRLRSEAWFSQDAQTHDAIERLGIDLVIDVGANEGQFARKLREIYRGEIISLEPVSWAFEKLEPLAHTVHGWRAYKVAAGSSQSQVDINVSNKTNFSSLLEPSAYSESRFGKDVATNIKEAISVRRLDEFLRQVVPDIGKRRIFLKLDTQGYDLEAFRGASGILDRIYILQSEVSLIHLYENMPHWTISINEYERSGFGVLGLFPVARDRNSGQIIEYDCLMTKASREHSA